MQVRVSLNELRSAEVDLTNGGALVIEVNEVAHAFLIELADLVGAALDSLDGDSTADA